MDVNGLLQRLSQMVLAKAKTNQANVAVLRIEMTLQHRVI